MGDMTSVLCALLTRAHFAGVPTTRSLWSHVSFALDAAKDELPPQDLVQHVLEACLQHPLNSLAPRDRKHDLSVLRWLGQAWQTRGWSVPEVLDSGDQEDPDDCPELCYKTYVGWGGDIGADMRKYSEGVTLLESSGGIIHHTTGLTTWGGAAILANWVTDYPEVISGRRVLELGAGVGFTASVILTSHDKEHSPPISYTATDCHHHVLTLLHHNLELNLRKELMKREELEAFQVATGRVLVSEEVQAGQILPWNPPSPHLRLSSNSHDERGLECVTQYGTKVDVLQVDWRQPCRLPDVDVIVAADVVYAHHLIPPLVTLIKSILNGTATKKPTGKTKATRKRRPKSESNKTDGEDDTQTQNHQEESTMANGYSETPRRGGEEEGEEEKNQNTPVERVAYIACTRRSHETMSLFLEEVANQGLAHSLVYQATLDTDTFLFLYNETHLPIKIYKVVLPPQENGTNEP